jgi:cytochrome b561
MRYKSLVRLTLVALSLVATTLVVTPAIAREPNEEARLEAEARKRATLRTYHRSLGITTWISLAATTAIGTIRYANVIGFGTPLCESGSPIFGHTWGCGDGLLIQHGVSAGFTTLSYASTRTLAALMPDPYDAAADNPRLSAHRALSWVHLAGMIAMPILGIATASSDDADTRRTLATTHLIVGYSTFAAVSTAGALMVF